MHIGNKTQTYKLLETDVAELAITASEPTDAMYEYQKLDKERLILVMNRVQGKLLSERDVTASQFCQLGNR